MFSAEFLETLGGTVDHDVFQHLGSDKGGGRGKNRGDCGRHFRPGVAIAIINTDNVP